MSLVLIYPSGAKVVKNFDICKFLKENFLFFKNFIFFEVDFIGMRGE